LFLDRLDENDIMPQFSFFLLIIIIMIVSFIIFYARSTGHRGRIQRYLEREGANDIRIETVWFTGDQGSFTYRVMYRDNCGEQHRTRCKVTRNRFWSDDRIYWDRPIAVSQVSQSPSPFGETQLIRSSSKEEIITDLTDEVERLKLELKQFQGADSAENIVNTT
jgi:hypothetical protein